MYRDLDIFISIVNFPNKKCSHLIPYLLFCVKQNILSKGRKTGTDTPQCGEEYQKASALAKDKFCSKRALGRPFFVHSLDEQRMDRKFSYIK